MNEYQFIRDDDGIIRSVQHIPTASVIFFMDLVTDQPNTSLEYEAYREWLLQGNTPAYPD